MSKNKKKRGLSSINLSARTKVIIAGVGAVLIVLGIVAAILIVLASKTKPVDDVPKGPLTAEQKRQAWDQQSKELLAAVTEAQSAIERGDSAKVATIYDAALKRTDDTTSKIRLLVDESRVYLIGVSGGGHMAMLMAGRHPELWAGVSAWCGIADIAQWYGDHTKDSKPDKYAQNIEAALGHAPAVILLQNRAHNPSGISMTAARAEKLAWMLHRSRTDARGTTCDQNCVIHG